MAGLNVSCSPRHSRFPLHPVGKGGVNIRVTKLNTARQSDSTKGVKLPETAGGGCAVSNLPGSSGHPENRYCTLAEGKGCR